MQENIRKFLEKQKIMSLASTNADIPYCFIVLYVFDPLKNYCYFVSKVTSRHSKEIMVNSRVSGTIIKQETSILKLQGVQLTGTCRLLDGDEALHAESCFQKAYPISQWMKEKIWAVELNFVKMTDNTLGFSTKLIWERNADLPA